MTRGDVCVHLYATGTLKIIDFGLSKAGRLVTGTSDCLPIRFVSPVPPLP